MNFGEKVVLRILDKRKAVLPLIQLGFSPHNLDLYREKITSPYGMILHVGPTGSGKSMTLYAALNEIQQPDINIRPSRTRLSIPWLELIRCRFTVRSGSLSSGRCAAICAKIQTSS